ncbi:MAG: ABC transporter permease subunit, partial [Ligilactobacillus agilis]|nr:ABC transporter permease subunit [Ligilactobacillus agilis]
MDIFSYKLPIAHLIDQLTNWLTTNCAGFFNLITKGGSALMDFITNGLLFLPPLLLIALLTIAAYFGSNRHFKLPALTLLGLLFVYNQGLWTGLMNTFTLVLIASLVSVIIGIPLGIWMAKNDKVQAVVKPILDFMQTMPAFVYLIPAVAFFGIGMVPGVFASVILALPPTVRFTNLAIRQIPKELVEATDAFGSTPKQKLFSLELPMAKPTIWAGINQTIMLALSMVVTASMIGAPGLGKDVLSALQHANIGTGFVAGLALVILAIIIDRFTQKFNQPIQARPKLTPKQKRNHRLIVGGILAAIILVLGAGNFKSLTQKAKPTVNLGYVDWDSEVASTNVIA